MYADLDKVITDLYKVLPFYGNKTKYDVFENTLKSIVEKINLEENFYKKYSLVIAAHILKRTKELQPNDYEKFSDEFVEFYNKSNLAAPTYDFYGNLLEMNCWSMAYEFSEKFFNK